METARTNSIAPSRGDGIHEARESDLEAIFTLKDRAIRNLCAPSYSPQTITDWVESNDRRSLQEMIRKKEIDVIVVEGQVAGFVWRTWDNLRELMVDPGFTNRGIGSQLLDHALHKIGFYRLGVTTITATLNAVGFYEKHGFVAGERIKATNNRTGSELPMIEMTLRRESEDV